MICVCACFWFIFFSLFRLLYFYAYVVNKRHIIQEA